MKTGTVTFLIFAARKIIGAPPATAPRKKYLVGMEKCVSASVISFAKRKSPRAAPIINFKRKIWTN